VDAEARRAAARIGRDYSGRKLETSSPHSWPISPWPQSGPVRGNTSALPAGSRVTSGSANRRTRHAADPDDEIERIKRETDLAAVVRARGVALKPRAATWSGSVRSTTTKTRACT